MPASSDSSNHSAAATKLEAMVKSLIAPRSKRVCRIPPYFRLDNDGGLNPVQRLLEYRAGHVLSFRSRSDQRLSVPRIRGSSVQVEIAAGEHADDPLAPKRVRSQSCRQRCRRTLLPGCVCCSRSFAARAQLVVSTRITSSITGAHLQRHFGGASSGHAFGPRVDLGGRFQPTGSPRVRNAGAPLPARQ